MSLKMNFLIITSILVLTIFVKMVPAPEKENNEVIKTPLEVHRNDSAELKLPERNSIVIGMFDNVRKSEYANKHIVSCEELYEFNEMNKKEIAEYSEKIIKCEELYKNSDMNKSDIVEYCEKIRLEQKPDIAATILYIKDTLKRYNTYYPDISIGSNVFINYSSMKNNKDDPKLLEEMTEFKNIKEKDLRGLFQAVTSCYLIDDPYNKILIPSRTLYNSDDKTKFEGTFFLNQFRFFYNLSNAEISVIGNKHHVTVQDLLNIVKNDETDIKNDVTYVNKYHLNEFKSDTYLLFVKAYIKELHSHDPISFPMDALSPEDIVLISDKFNETEYQRTAVFSVRKYLVDQYIRFTSIWQLYRFDINLYLKYKIIDISNSFGYLIYDELMLNEIDGVKMTALEAFQKYFKESLDDSYNIVINMDINTLEDLKKTIYYKRTLRTLKNIFQAQFEETNTESASKFVQRMIVVAEAILNSDKTKQIPDQLKKEYQSYKDVCPKPHKPESDHTSEHKAPSEDKSDKIMIKNNNYTCDSTKCDLPDTVNCKDILNYMIVHYEKDIHEYRIEKVN